MKQEKHIPSPQAVSQTVKDHQERMNRVLLYIQEHIEEPLTLDVLAAVACFSPFHFHRIFAAYAGETVSSYVRRIRLERAAQALCHTDRPVTDIALSAGYETPGSFTKAFARYFNESPTHFRKSRSAYLVQQQKIIIIQQDMKGDYMKPEIRQQDRQRVLYVREIGRYDQAAGRAWEKLCAFAGPRGLLTGAADFIGIGHDDPTITPEDKLRYDACITVADEMQPEGEVGVQTIPGGRFAVFMHKGPYNNLLATYQQAYGQWLPASGEKLREAPCFEKYLNDCHQTPPEELMTEIWVPLQ
jgi:AraC family transcriptional regulator